ncbi:hypothetical protein L1049_027596 [Liquidambar formosana]|uniref:Uncharacterized protein n=1 Tax=Liquidambar formosana TaxID=63359 RepID=A0AAP0RHP1_LIQFO
MKTAFHNLKAQIKFGLLQAEDVFASLSIPLMRLVGLKNAEMIEEGRFTTIFMDAQSFQGCGRNGLGSETPSRSQSSVEDAHQNHQIRNLEEESYATKVAMAGKELREKQQLQLTQLVHLLRQIETQVNSSQNDILQTLAHHRLYLQKFFQGAISYISTTHRPTAEP